jgi:hypothetical protein
VLSACQPASMYPWHDTRVSLPRCTGALPTSTSSEPANYDAREAIEASWPHSHRVLHPHRRQQERLARHGSTFSTSPTTRVGAIELLTAHWKHRYAAHMRAPTPWRSRAPSLRLSMSACMSMHAHAPQVRFFAIWRADGGRRWLSGRLHSRLRATATLLQRYGAAGTSEGGRHVAVKCYFH